MTFIPRRLHLTCRGFFRHDLTFATENRCRQRIQRCKRSGVAAGSAVRGQVIGHGHGLARLDRHGAAIAQSDDDAAARGGENSIALGQDVTDHQLTDFSRGRLGFYNTMNSLNFSDDLARHGDSPTCWNEEKLGFRASKVRLPVENEHWTVVHLPFGTRDPKAEN